MKWGCAAPHNLSAVYSQLPRNLDSNRTQAYIWATKWSTLSLLVTVTPWSSHSNWRMSSWRANAVTCTSGVLLHGVRKLDLIASFSLVVITYHVLIWVTNVLIVWFLYSNLLAIDSQLNQINPRIKDTTQDQEILQFQVDQ